MALSPSALRERVELFESNLYLAAISGSPGHAAAYYAGLGQPLIGVDQREVDRINALSPGCSLVLFFEALGNATYLIRYLRFMTYLHQNGGELSHARLLYAAAIGLTHLETDQLTTATLEYPFLCDNQTSEEEATEKSTAEAEIESSACAALSFFLQHVLV